MKIKIILTFFILICAGFFVLQKIPKAQAQTTPSTTDWYMSGANPQRTSWVSSGVTGDLGVEWYRPIDPYIPAKVQIIATDNTLYLSTAKGLFAFQAESGAQKWVYPTKLPLGNSPTVVNKVAYVPGMDHRLYAVFDNGNFASLLWSFDGAMAGYDTNPLVVNNMVYLGNRDGNFYAIYSNDYPDQNLRGKMKWKFPTSGQIHFSAAYKNGFVYFASDDAFLYKLNADTGAMVWKSSKMPASEFHSWWPVIHTPTTGIFAGRDLIVMVGSQNYRVQVGPGPGEDLQNLDANEFLVNINTESNHEIGPRVNGKLDMSRAVPYLEDTGGSSKKYRRTYFVIDDENGQELTFNLNGNSSPDYAPFFWWGTRSGMRYPPIVSGVDNVIYQPNTFYVEGQYATRGQIVGWEVGSKYVTTPAGAVRANDEPIAYSGGGDNVYWKVCCDRTAGGFKVDGSVSPWEYFPYDTVGSSLSDSQYMPGYDVKTTGRDEANAVQVYGDSRVNDENGNPTGWNGVAEGQNGIYGAHGDQSPPVPYGGKLYMIVGNAISAWSTNNSRTKLPIAKVVDVQDELLPFDTNSLKQKLETEVQKIVGIPGQALGDHLKPGFGNHGYFVKVINIDDGDFFADYFHTTSDLIYSLSLAFPHLSQPLQNQVKSYLLREMQNYSPCVYRHNGWIEGESRDLFDHPKDIKDDFVNYGKKTAGNFMYPGWEWPPFTFYALWKYALISGDGVNIFNSCSSLGDGLNTAEYLLNPPTNTFISRPEAHNAWVAGLTGYVELAKLAGKDNAFISPYVAKLNQIKNSRVSNFPNTINSPFGPESHNSLQSMAISRNFMFMTPELASHLRASNSFDEITRAFEMYSKVGSYWMAGRFDAMYGETIVQPLFDMEAMFNAKAMIFQAKRDDLGRYLDGPGFLKGDYYFINNSVRVLEAEGLLCGELGDIDCSGQVNALDLVKLVFDFFSDSSVSDLDGSGQVNSLDLAILINNYGK